VVDLLVRGPEHGGGAVRFAGAGVAGVARERAAGDLHPDAVAAPEAVRGGPQPDGGGGPPVRAGEAGQAVADVGRPAARIDVAEPDACAPRPPPASDPPGRSGTGPAARRRREARWTGSPAWPGRPRAPAAAGRTSRRSRTRPGCSAPAPGIRARPAAGPSACRSARAGRTGSASARSAATRRPTAAPTGPPAARRRRASVPAGRAGRPGRGRPAAPASGRAGAGGWRGSRGAPLTAPGRNRSGGRPRRRWHPACRDWPRCGWPRCGRSRPRRG
jgi:hypothetical protein